VICLDRYGIEMQSGWLAALRVSSYAANEQKNGEQLQGGPGLNL
jgi:hypothetical protein